MSFKAICLILASIFCLSCGGELKSDFVSELSQSDFEILNIKGTSCKNQVDPPDSGDPRDISEMILPARKITITWTETFPLELSFIRFTLYSENIPGGFKEITLSGPDLGYLIQGTLSPTMVQTITVTKSSSPNCYLQLGPIQFVDPKIDTAGVGEMLIVGQVSIDNKIQTRVSRKSFDWSYTYQF